MNKILYILTNYLKAENYYLNTEAVKLRLYSDYNSIVVAITNTLEFFNIENVVARVPLNSFNELPNIFLAEITSEKHSDIVLVNKIEGDKVKITFDISNEIILNHSDFVELWTGIVIVIERNNTKKLKRNKFSIVRLVSLSLAVLVVFYSFLLTSSLLSSTFITFTVLGILVSLVVMKKKYVDNNNEKTCKLINNSNLSSFINATNTGLFFNIQLIDIVIIYFLSTIFTFLAFPISFSTSFIPILSLPIILQIVYLQFIKNNIRCVLCHIISIVLFVHLLFFIVNLEKLQYNYQLYPFFTIVVISIGLIWYFIKPFLSYKKENSNLELQNLSFRRNKKLFNLYLESLNTLGINSIQNEIVSIGNIKSKLVLSVITNPTCKYCKDAHKVVMNIFHKFSNDLKINFIFLVPNKNSEDTRTIVAGSLLQLYKNEGEKQFIKAIDSWFNERNIEKWLNTWKQEVNNDTKKELSKQVNWLIENNITGTPVIFINEKKYPAMYHIKDLEELIEGVIVKH